MMKGIIRMTELNMMTGIIMMTGLNMMIGITITKLIKATDLDPLTLTVANSNNNKKQSPCLQ